MDPNETLQEIRQILCEPEFYSIEYLVTRIDALDSWISKGGFLPEGWNHQCSNICCEI